SVRGVCRRLELCAGKLARTVLRGRESRKALLLPDLQVRGVAMSDLRFTDKPVPRVVLENVANWVHAYGEEGRKGQDESTIKPQSQQRKIDTNTQYTAVDIWLANGDTTIGLLMLSSCDPRSISVYEGDCIWCVGLNVRTGLWEMDKYRNPDGLQIDDQA